MKIITQIYSLELRKTLDIVFKQYLTCIRKYGEKGEQIRCSVVKRKKKKRNLVIRELT